MSNRTREVGALGALLKTFFYPGRYKSVSPYKAISLLKMALTSANDFMSSLQTDRDRPVPLRSFTLTGFDLMSH